MAKDRLGMNYETETYFSFYLQLKPKNTCIFA